LSGNEVRNSAEAQVWNNRAYDVTRKPVPGGLLDTRMVCVLGLFLPPHESSICLGNLSYQIESCGEWNDNVGV
jgi:hypothetical protein